ncbi:hypothetical protein BXZ70DRAFT_175477 [Cristinia sonorae]|uniref:Cupredoxin n=1 Tax=Cristinia sonorae TaxID=1940300 RepID=A0A8K0XPL7_9AGAR|nr:hypothetical protein BXZ70DRAFT_175477 [Cristinia sonorae]
MAAFRAMLAYAIVGFIVTIQSVFAQTELTVTVGGLPPGDTKNDLLQFNPPYVIAENGTRIVFIMKQFNHTLTESTFEKPCELKDGGFETGFIPVPAGATDDADFPKYIMTLTSTDPIWIYCRTGPHCSRGMVFAINPPNRTMWQAFVDGTNKYRGSALPAPTPLPIGGSDPSGSGASLSTGAAVVATATVAVSGFFQTFTYSSYPGSAAPTSLVSTEHVVSVGGADQLSFFPPKLIAQPGDTITFQFTQGNHSVVQSSFEHPCDDVSMSTGQTGFNSGFMPMEGKNSTSTYTVMVNDTAPIFAFCSQRNPKDHCRAGMVFAANTVESSSSNFLAFQRKALRLDPEEPQSPDNQTSTSTGSGPTSSPSSTSDAMRTTGHIYDNLFTGLSGMYIALVCMMNLLGET